MAGLDLWFLWEEKPGETGQTSKSGLNVVQSLLEDQISEGAKLFNNN